MASNNIPQILFVTLSHQYNNFLIWHSDYIKKNKFINSDYLLIDEYTQFSKNKRNSLLFLFFTYLNFFKKFNIKNKNNNFKLIISSHPISGLFLLLYLCTNPKKKIIWVHWFTGQVWATQIGIKKRLYKSIDILICKKANYVFCDSKSQVSFLKLNGFDNYQNLIAPGLGSINGVAKLLLNDTPKKIDKNNIRLGYVGRISKDKGILDLLNEFAKSSQENFSLEIYGEIDDTRIRFEFLDLVSKVPKVNFYGSVSDKRLIYSNIDILIQPSLREGFSNVLIEAQAQGIPVVVRDIYGVKDAYKDGVTGTTFKNNCEIFESIYSIIKEENIFKCFQKNARIFASDYESDIVLSKIYHSYTSCFCNR